MSIKSESSFILHLSMSILLLPISLILWIFGRRDFLKRHSPFKEIFNFLFSAKATSFLVLINILCFIFVVVLSAYSPDFASQLIRYPSDFLSIRAYSLITSGFIHGDFMHLFWNMLFLFVFGRIVERKVGSRKMILIYFLALIISQVLDSIALLILGINAGSIGASGAIMGIVSAAILLDPFYFTHLLIVPVPVMLIGWMLILDNLMNVGKIMNSSVGYIAHLAGFVSIGVIAGFLSGTDKARLKKGFLINIAVLLVAVFAFLLFRETITSLIGKFVGIIWRSN
jgi:membrane associated rhomboid family serine protease